MIYILQLYPQSLSKKRVSKHYKSSVILMYFISDGFFSLKYFI